MKQMATTMSLSSLIIDDVNATVLEPEAGVGCDRWVRRQVARIASVAAVITAVKNARSVATAHSPPRWGLAVRGAEQQRGGHRGGAEGGGESCGLHCSGSSVRGG